MGARAYGDQIREEQDEWVDVDGAGLMVHRTELVAKVVEQVRAVGIVLICAPEGYGKTSLLLQCAASVRADPKCGQAALLSAEKLDGEELLGRIERCTEGLSPAMDPIICIDDVPDLDGGLVGKLAGLLRRLRDEGYGFVLACGPEAAGFVATMGDSRKVSAATMRVQPREYAQWARTFSISPSLDVYELTGGVPALVSSLRLMSTDEGLKMVQRLAGGLYLAALEMAAKTDQALYRLMALVVLMGTGVVSELERGGMRVRKETLAQLRRDYPFFGIDPVTGEFSCLALGSRSILEVQARIARERPELVGRAVRAHIRAGRMGEAVDLMGRYLPGDGSLPLLAQFPTEFALAGYGNFVMEVLGSVDAVRAGAPEAGVVVALYLAALTCGDYRCARAAAKELCRSASDADNDVAQADWACAQAAYDAWGSCSSMVLPDIKRRHSEGRQREAKPREDTLNLRMHARSAVRIQRGEPIETSGFAAEIERARAGDVKVSRLLGALDDLMEAALHGGPSALRVESKVMNGLIDLLRTRRLTDLVSRVRLADALQRLADGLPIVDERVFGDAGDLAVRLGDLSTQLLCLLGEGWQQLSLGQVMNAQFRGQQVMRLANETQPFLKDWAGLLAQTASTCNASLATLREEAGLIDPATDPVTPGEAWSVAIQLSAARFDSDLSLWFSLHKDLLYDVRFRPQARIAIRALGRRADAIRRIVPQELALELCDEPLEERVARSASIMLPVPELGQVNVTLFGGFHIDRNGHVLADTLLRRRKTGALAARLALCAGSFVGRETLIAALWPDSDERHGRQNLYSTVSSLKIALSQEQGGPQYILTQADGVAFNPEYVACDTGTFDSLARAILIKRTGMSPREIIDACLKLEEVYVGELFVPSMDDTVFFKRMQRGYHTRFIDAMVRGIDLALEEEDIASATWLVEAALKHDAEREDVLRRALLVYGAAGRRREVLALYSTYRDYALEQFSMEPERKTRETFEEVMREMKASLLP